MILILFLLYLKMENDLQIEENSRALEYLGHGIGGSIGSLEASHAATSSNAKAEKWKQGARKTLLNWVSNAIPKYV